MNECGYEVSELGRYWYMTRGLGVGVRIKSDVFHVFPQNWSRRPS